MRALHRAIHELRVDTEPLYYQEEKGYMVLVHPHTLA